MTVEVFKEGDLYVAQDLEVAEIGYGETEAEARAELDKSLRELHDRLNELGEDRLGPQLAATRLILNRRYADA